LFCSPLFPPILPQNVFRLHVLVCLIASRVCQVFCVSQFGSLGKPAQVQSKLLRLFGLAARCRSNRDASQNSSLLLLNAYSKRKDTSCQLSNILPHALHL